MGRTKAKFENVGRIKTIFTVNFDDPESILAIILPLMENRNIKSKVIKLGLGIVKCIDDTTEDGIEQVTKLLQFLSPSVQNPVDVKFMLQAFGCFVSNLPIDQQLSLYTMLGRQLNQPLQEHSEDTPKMENVDIKELLKSSGKEVYDKADPRLRTFIEAAVHTDYTEKYGCDNANMKKNWILSQYHWKFSGGKKPSVCQSCWVKFSHPSVHIQWPICSNL